jgi:hypothetical protein
MTLVNDIITRAYRENNLISKGAVPTTTEVDEALPLLNTIVLSAVGFEVGDALTDIAIGGTNDQSTLISNFVPQNSRLVLNLSAATTIKLNPYPQNGERFAIVDVANNLATYPLTIDANGKSIEFDFTEVINTNSFVGQWIYYADDGNWVRVNSLATGDDMPFPEEFDDYFALMLAVRLSPRHGVRMPPESLAALKRAKAQINARFWATKKVESDVPIVRLLSNFYFFGDSDFSTGRP